MSSVLEEAPNLGWFVGMPGTIDKSNVTVKYVQVLTPKQELDVLGKHKDGLY